MCCQDFRCSRGTGLHPAAPLTASLPSCTEDCGPEAGTDPRLGAQDRPPQGLSQNWDLKDEESRAELPDSGNSMCRDLRQQKAGLLEL